MIRHLFCALLLSVPAVCAAAFAQSARAPAATAPAAAPLDKASRLFLKHGLQIHALIAYPGDPFDVKIFRAAGFNGVNWGWSARVTEMGKPPGIPWNFWAAGEEQIELPAEYQPYASNLVAWQLRDEQDMNNPDVRAAAQKWFNAVRPRFPNTILYSNQYGGQVTNENMGKYFEACRPDMLSFDTYPVVEPATNWPAFYGDAQRYRKLALGWNIPYALWIQTFNGENRYRNPSESELRRNVFSAWCFGYKMTTCFLYSNSASSLFIPKTHKPAPAYHWIAKINRESSNLSPALVRLKSTDVRLLPGEHLAGGKSAANPAPIDIQPWAYNQNDPWLRGVAVKNLGLQNDGLKGDVYIGWFKPIADPAHADEIYFMIQNALSTKTGSAGACRQRLSLNFHFRDSGISSLQRLSRITGKVEDVRLTPGAEKGRFLLDLELDGGSADLFKFNTGVPFVK